MIQVGNVQLNPEAFKDYTKEQFFKEYTGKLSRDKEDVWNEIQDANKKQITVNDLLTEEEQLAIGKEAVSKMVRNVNDGLKNKDDASSDKPGKSGKKSDS